MKRSPVASDFILLGGLALLALMTGCKVHVDKDANGQEKNVQVDTPFGGVHVTTDQTTAADLGLPVYPGAQLATGDDDHKSADVHMGFGQWEMRVKVVSYSAQDGEDKVTDFYRKALARYGDVISCQDNKPVGTPTETSEGLNCSDNHADVNVDSNGHKYGYQSNKGEFQLKAGSKHHQHIVGFESSAPGQTRFALVAVDLPSESGTSGANSD